MRLPRFSSLPPAAGFAAAAALFSFALPLAWALLTPVDGVADEREHLLRAAAVARGEFVADRNVPAGMAGAWVHAPASIDALTKTADCFKFHPEKDASCAVTTAGPDTIERVLSAAGRYAPPYYFVAGLPSLVFPGAAGIYLMRVMSGLVAGALVFAALAVTAARGRPLAALGVLVATTPIALSLDGGVNPSSWEIAAATLAWTAGAALAVGPAAARPGPLLTALGAGVALCAITRQLSPFWMALAGLVLLVAAGRARASALSGLRPARVAAVVAALAAVASTAWTLAVDALAISPLNPQPYSIEQRIEYPFRLFGWRLEQMVGLVGWLDTPSPVFTYVAWAAVGGTLVLLAAGARRWRWQAALGLVIALSVLVPWVLEARQMRVIGLFWEGRYGLPLAVGVPILAGAIADWSPAVPPALARSLAAIGAALLAVAQFAAAWWAMLRWESGVDTTLNPLAGAWHPPVPHVAVLGLAALGSAGCALVVRSRLYNRAV